MKIIKIYLIVLSFFCFNCKKKSNKYNYVEVQRLKLLLIEERFFYAQHQEYTTNLEELEKNIYIDDLCPSCEYSIFYKDSTYLYIQSINLTDYDKDGDLRIMMINKEGEIDLLQED